MSRASTVKEKPMVVHRLHGELRHEREINIALVGCGGNGAQMLTKLARLQVAMASLALPDLKVFAFDPDVVTRANLGRQMFSPADVGLPKATVLVNRINAFFGLNWESRVEEFTEGIHSPAGVLGPHWRTNHRTDLVVSCVDSARARRRVAKSFENGVMNLPCYWLDLGNSRDTGQVILGEPEKVRLAPITITGEEFAQGMSKAEMNRRMREAAKTQRLPTVLEVFPELTNYRLREANEPSCSAAEALTKQALFINDHISTWAAQLLYDLLVEGQIRYHGAFINTATGLVTTLPVPERAGVSLETKEHAAARDTRMGRRAA